MAGPGGVEVGRVSVRVVPNTEDFRRDLKRDLEEIEKTLKVEIPVEADTAKAMADIAALRKELKTLRDQVINIRVNQHGGIAGATRQMRNLGNEAEKTGKKIRASFDVTRAGGIFGNLASITTSVSGLLVDSFKMVSSVGVTAFKALFTSATELGSGLMTSLSEGVQSFGKNAAQAAASAVALAFQLGVWIGLISVIVGAVMYLGGLLAAVFGSLPALLTAVVAPVAAVVLGMDGIKRAAEQLKAPLDRLKQGLSDTFERGLTPVFRELAKVFPEIQFYMNGIAEELSEFAGELVKVISSEQGIRNLQSALNGVRTFIDTMTPGASRLFQALMDIARTERYYKILGETFDGVFTSLARFFDTIRQSGELTKGLENLRDTLISVTNLFGALFEGALRFFNGAAPGLTKFFDGLSSFFARIDWEKLGAAFGRIFESLGNWFMNMDQSMIDSFVNAFVELADSITQLIDSGVLNVLALGLRMVLEVLQWILDAVNGFAAFVEWLLTVPDMIMGVFSGIEDWLTDSGRNLMSGFENGARQSFIDFVAWLGEIPGKIGEFFANAWDWLIEEGHALLGGFADGANQSWINFIGWLGQIPGWIGGVFRDAWNWLIGSGRALLGGFADGANQRWIDFIGWLGGIPGAIGGFFAAAGTWLVQAGKNIIQGLWNGMKDIWNSVTSWLANLAPSIINLKGPPAKDARILIGNGELIMQGLFRGLRNGWATVAAYLQSLSTEISGSVGTVDLAANVSYNGQDINALNDATVEAAATLHGDGFEERMERVMANWSVVVDKFGAARLVKSAERDNKFGR